MARPDAMPAFVPVVEMRLSRRGSVVLIPNTKEFFIALRDHPEYGAAHTVFGAVSTAKLRAGPALLFLPRVWNFLELRMRLPRPDQRCLSARGRAL